MEQILGLFPREGVIIDYDVVMITPLVNFFFINGHYFLGPLFLQINNGCPLMTGKQAKTTDMIKTESSNFVREDSFINSC